MCLLQAVTIALLTFYGCIKYPKCFAQYLVGPFDFCTYKSQSGVINSYIICN